MGLLRLVGFTGMWPVRDPRALPDNAAVDAENIRVDGGAYLKPLRVPTLIKALQATTQMVFRIPLAGANTLANSFWMEFNDPLTDVFRGPLKNDSFKRYYWASPSTGLKYAAEATITGGGTGFDAGVPAPATAPLLTVVAGTGAIDPTTGENTGTHTTRDYVVTFINQFGEESPPSPAVEGSGAVDQDWLLTSIPQPGSPGTRASYSTIRIYRTVTGLSGQTQFYKVVDLAVGTTFYTDRLSDILVSGQTALGATYYAPPPSGLQGLAAMPNGIFVSWKDNTLYFSENYRPHAWPAEYELTVDYPIVGLGVFGNSCVVCTTGSPFIVTGTQSASMTLTKTDAPLPCLSRRSIVSAPEGVYYASDEGLVLIGPNGINVITQDLFDRRQWRNDYVPSSMKSMFFNGQYIAIATVANSDGFMFQPAEPSKKGVVKWDSFLSNPVQVGVEPWTGKPWLVGDIGDGVRRLYEWEEPSAANASFMWKSKEIQYPKPCNFSVAQIYFDDTVGGFQPHVRIWAILRGNDGTLSTSLVFDQTITKSGAAFRLPSGFKSDIWQVELSGAATVQSFMMATSVQELARE